MPDARAAEDKKIYRFIQQDDYEVNARLRNYVAYDDNVFRTNSNETDDIVYTIMPSFDAKTKWDKHGLALKGKVKNVRYHNNKSDNHTNFDVDGTGYYDVNNHVRFGTRAGYREEYMDRGLNLSDRDSNRAKPTFFKQADIGTQLGLYGDQASLFSDIGATYYDYDDVERIGGGVIDQDDRDRSVFSGEWQFSYAFSDEFDLLGIQKLNKKIYDVKSASNRDSWGYESLAGLAYEPGEDLKIQAVAGYMHQQFEQGDIYQDIRDPAYELSLQWKVTPKWRVLGSARKVIEETTDTGVSAVTMDDWKIGSFYKIDKIGTTEANFRYRNKDFAGGTGADDGSPREEDLYDVNLRFFRDIADGVRIEAKYTNSQKESNNDSVEYDRNRYSFGLFFDF